MSRGGLTYHGAIAVGKVVVSLAVISVVVFLATNALPSDPARAALGKGATPEQLALYREAQGLDRPVHERYFVWLGKFVRGDWGDSVVTRRPVRVDVEPRMKRTFTLALLGFALALPVSLALGLYTGKRSGRRIDVGVSVGTLLVASLPEFIIGLILLLIFAVALGWLPVESSIISFDASLGELARAYALPTLTLALVVAPYVTRMMRANTREVVGEPYTRSAVLRGVSGTSLTFRHILPNAAPPVVNVLALNLAEIIGGVVVVEAVFAFPGAGQLLVQAVGSKDIPTVQALALIIGTFFVVLNLVADLIVIALTPRLRTATA